MNLKSVHTKPAPKAESKNISLNHKIGDVASNEAKQLAFQYIDEWVHSPAIRTRCFSKLSDIELERAVDWFYYVLTVPRKDSVKNQKTGRVGLSKLDTFMDLITENNTNTDTTWQQKLRGFVKQCCNRDLAGFWEKGEGNVIQHESSYDEFASNNEGGESVDVESTGAFRDADNDFEHYGESEEEYGAGSGYSDNDFFRKFKSLPREKQEEIIKQFGTGKHIEDPRMNRIYKALRQYVKKGTDIGDSADIPAAIPANITRLAADLILWAIDNLDSDEQLYEWHYSKDRWDALKKWAETLYNNTEEIDESYDGGYDSEEVADSAPSDTEVDALLSALNADGANVTKEQLMKAYASFKKDAQVADSKIVDEDAGPKQGLTPDQWPTEVEDPNTGEMKPVGDIKKADSKKLKKNDLVTIIGAKRVKSKVKDSVDITWSDDSVYVNGMYAGFIDRPVQGTEAWRGGVVCKENDYGYVRFGDGDPEALKQQMEEYINKHEDQVLASCDKSTAIKDSTRQFKVYYLDENRKTRTLFIKAYDEDDALGVAAEKIPAGCEVHSAVDTNPLG